MGKRLSFGDPRATVFSSVMEVIFHQATADQQLMFFILENVTGMLKRRRGTGTAPADEIMEHLRCNLGNDWTLTMHK
eukprot:7561223-Prorocentrum_lima.AAC.1